MPLQHAAGLFTLVVMLCMSLILIRRAQGGKLPWIRKLPAVDAMEEGIARAVELDKGVLVTIPSYQPLFSAAAPENLAALSMFPYIVKMCVAKGARLLASAVRPEIFAIMKGTVTQEYAAAGKSSEVREDTVRIVASTVGYEHANALMGWSSRENLGTGIVIGYMGAETIILCEGLNFAGLFVVGGTANIAQIPFAVTAMDYSVMGEEIFAMSAYLTKDPVQLGSVQAQDWEKFVLIGFVLVGIVLATAGFNLTKMLGL